MVEAEPEADSSSMAEERADRRARYERQEELRKYLKTKKELDTDFSKADREQAEKDFDNERADESEAESLVTVRTLKTALEELIQYLEGSGLLVPHLGALDDILTKTQTGAEFLPGPAGMPNVTSAHKKNMVVSLEEDGPDSAFKIDWVRLHD